MNEISIIHNNKELKEMADAMGPLFGKVPRDMFALMLMAQAEGSHPAKAAQDYDIIKGKPALKSIATLGRFQAAGGKIKWITRSDAEAKATFSHPAGGELTVSWTWDRAVKAGLTEKETWKQYPTQMLSARTVAEGIRAIYPACLSGFYMVEEVQDFDTKPAEPRDVTPPAPAQPTKPAPEAKQVQDAEIVQPDQPQDTPPEEIGVDIAAYKARRTEVISELVKIVGATDTPGAWSDAEKDLIGTKALLAQSAEKLDTLPLEVLLLRAKIGQAVINTGKFLEVIEIATGAGFDLEKLNGFLAQALEVAEQLKQEKPADAATEAAEAGQMELY